MGRPVIGVPAGNAGGNRSEYVAAMGTPIRTEPSQVSMDYGLTRLVLSRTAFLPITREDFEAARRAKAMIVAALGIEETFNLVAGNYLEYEDALLGGALECIVYSEGSWSEFTGRIHDINRRMMNLLAAGRAYLDQAAHYLSSTFAETSPECIRFREATNDEYDGRLGYRAMEALRNFALHRGLAVHGLTHDNWSEGEGEERIRYNAMVPSINPGRLAEEGGFKSAVLTELAALGDRVDLRPLVKEYVAGLAAVHVVVREVTATAVDGADEIVLGHIARYRAEGEDRVVGLAAVERTSQGVHQQEIQLFDDPIVRRKELVTRLHRLKYVAGLYTTNQPRRDRDVSA